MFSSFSFYLDLESQDKMTIPEIPSHRNSFNMNQKKYLRYKQEF